MNLRIFLLVITLLMLFASHGHTQTDSVNTDSVKAIDMGVDIYRYPFIAGDALKISVYPDTNSFPGGVYMIDGEGYVDLPVIGYIMVTDKSVSELEAMLKQTYLQFMRYPYLTVRPLMRMGLFGGFTRPGLYYIDPRATMWEAVRNSGITQRRDGITKVTWERDHSIIQKDIVPFFQSHQSLYQIGFRSGDRLTVTQRPERTRWEVFRAEALPLLSFVLSTALSAATLYQTYNVLRETRN